MTAFSSIPINGELLLVDLDPENDRNYADELSILRLSAGLTATGPLDLEVLQSQLDHCPTGDYATCEFCQALANVIDRLAPENHETERHEGVEPLERW